MTEFAWQFRTQQKGRKSNLSPLFPLVALRNANGFRPVHTPPCRRGVFALRKSNWDRRMLSLSSGKRYSLKTYPELAGREPPWEKPPKLLSKEGYALLLLSYASCQQ